MVRMPVLPDIAVIIMLWIIPYLLLKCIGQIVLSEENRNRAARAMGKGDFKVFLSPQKRMPTQMYRASAFFSFPIILLFIALLIVAQIRLSLPKVFMIMVLAISILLQIKAAKVVGDYKRSLQENWDSDRVQITGWWQIEVMGTPMIVISLVIAFSAGLHLLQLAKLLLWT